MKWMVCLVAVGCLAGCAEVDDLLHPSRAGQAVVQGQTCRYRDVAPNGTQSKICSYDCGGGQLVGVPVKAGESCPATTTYP